MISTGAFQEMAVPSNTGGMVGTISEWTVSR
jgi:hypothetical protein